MSGYEKSKVKVSIGMPVYNGASYIRRALDSLLAQSFGDFELIISDNASTDDTQTICEKYERADSRVRYIQQERNLGPIRNFDFVLNQSEGEYFMWAAHDDLWEPRFLEVLIREFQKLPEGVVAIGCEAQYMVGMEKKPFFAEGKAFYRPLFELEIDRVSHMLKHAYGNLFYSLYRRQALFLNGVSILSATARVSLNELPLFIPVAFQGNWKILSEVLFYKETTMPTYSQARWEMEGGLLPCCSIRHFISGVFYGLKYHILTAVDISRSIGTLPLSGPSQKRLQVRSLFILLGHFILCMIHYKRQPVSNHIGLNNE